MSDDTKHPAPVVSTKKPAETTKTPAKTGEAATVTEIGGPSGPEPTRYGDWERGGRCSDF